MRGEEEEVAEKTRGGLRWESGPARWVGVRRGRLQPARPPAWGRSSAAAAGGWPCPPGTPLLGALSCGEPRGAAALPP